MQSSVVLPSVIGIVWEKNGNKKGHTENGNFMDGGLALKPSCWSIFSL